MKVKEIMTKEVTRLSAETNAMEALVLLQKVRISGLPVIDDKNKLVGMFTEKEILAVILPSYIDKVGKFMYEENPKVARQKISALTNMKVKELMRKEVITVDEDKTLYEVARIMLTQKARRIPVINKSGDIVGIVARCDIVKALFSEYKN